MHEECYHPVKDLLTEDMRKRLIKNFESHEHKHMIYKNEEFNRRLQNVDTLYQFYIDFGHDKKVDFETFKENIQPLVESVKDYAGPIVSYFKACVRDFDFSVGKDRVATMIRQIDQLNPYSGSRANFHTPIENPDSVTDVQVIDKIVSIYGGDAGVYIHTKGEGDLLSPHKDPVRCSCLTFPLYPSYDVYRHTQFYEEDMATLKCEVEWNKVRSPCLLNNQQVHGLNNEQKNLHSLCFQISYNSRPFEEVREMLRERDLLIDV